MIQKYRYRGRGYRNKKDTGLRRQFSHDTERKRKSNRRKKRQRRKKRKKKRNEHHGTS